MHSVQLHYARGGISSRARVTGGAPIWWGNLQALLQGEVASPLPPSAQPADSAAQLQPPYLSNSMAQGASMTPHHAAFALRAVMAGMSPAHVQQVAAIAADPTHPGQSHATALLASDTPCATEASRCVGLFASDTKCWPGLRAGVAGGAAPGWPRSISQRRRRRGPTLLGYLARCDRRARRRLRRPRSACLRCRAKMPSEPGRAPSRRSKSSVYESTKSVERSVSSRECRAQ